MGFTHADTAIAQATSAVTSQSVTLSAAVSIGDVLCLVWGSPNPDSDTVTDNSPGGSQTWITPAAAANFSKFAYLIATKAAPSGLTITTTGGGGGTRFMVADRFSVSGGTATFGSDVTAAISGTNGNMGSISSVPAGELLWGGAHSDDASATFTAGSSNGVNAVIGSQIGNTGGSGFSQYILSGAGGTESMTWTSSITLTGRQAWETYFTVTAPPPPAGTPPIIPTSGGDRDVAIRMFRALAPGDVPAAGAQLPRLHGRAFLVPVPIDTEHATRTWPEAPPEPSAAEQIITAMEETLGHAAAAGSRIVETGRIFADPPYERQPKKCGVIRKIGGIMLTCRRKPGHTGKHTDRGLDWG